MNFAIDAILIIVAVMIIWSAAKKGLIRAVMGVFTSVASLIAAYAYTPVLSDYIREKFLLDRITGNIAGTLKGWALDTASDLYNLDRLVAPLNPDFSKILERYGVEAEKIVSELRGLVGVNENEVNNIAEHIALPTTNVLASAIAFILIFAAVFIVLSLITGLLDKIFKMPVLSGINKFLGILFGILEAGIVLYALAAVLSVLVSFLGVISPDLFGKEVIENTVVCKLLMEHNVFGWILDLLGV